MTPRLTLLGTALRYVLTHHLALHGPATVRELEEMLAWYGFKTNGRASKAISDALRWEMGRGRVFRRRRGLYVAFEMPRGTEHRIHKRVLELRTQAAELSLRGGQNGISSTAGCGRVTRGRQRQSREARE
jgi:hypothetical protein